MKRIIGLILATSTLLMSAQGQDIGNNYARAQEGKTRGAIGIDVPQDNSGAPMGVVRSRVEASTVDRAAKYKEMQVRTYERKRVLAGVYDASILMQPVKRIIRPVDTIGVAPLYITQIVFPEDMVITNAESSFETSTFVYNNNLLRIRPVDRDFFAGNIVLSLSQGKRNYSMTIFLERYFAKDCSIVSGEYVCRKHRGGVVPGESLTHGKGITGNYQFSLNNLSAFYVYVNPVKVEPMMAIRMYERSSGKRLYIPKNGGRVTFKYEGLFYNIIRDDKFGTVLYRGLKYSVVNR